MRPGSPALERVLERRTREIVLADERLREEL